jgi:heterodisulfide reductase subunit A-like polyferredoxin
MIRFAMLLCLPKTVRTKRTSNGINATWDGILRLGGAVIAPQDIPDSESQSGAAAVTQSERGGFHA